MEENILLLEEVNVWLDEYKSTADEKTKKRYSTRSYIEIDEDELCKY